MNWDGEEPVEILREQLAKEQQSVLFYIEERAHYKQVAERRLDLLKRAHESVAFRTWMPTELRDDIAKELK